MFVCTKSSSTMFTTYGPPTQPTPEEEYILFVYPPKNSQAAPLN